jgi:hypothetical protein
MEFCWVEQGVPPVEAVERRGFGKTVLVQMMQRAVHGSACLEFPPSGCRWKVTAPLVWVIEPGSGRLANDADSAAT